MKEQLINFETAKLAKEKGFNEWTNQVYRIVDKELMFEERGHQNSLSDINKKITAPTQALLQKWLREEHKINVESNYLPNIQKYRCLYVPMSKSISNKEKYSLRSKYYGTDDFETYEEALEKGLQEALKLIKL